MQLQLVRYVVAAVALQLALATSNVVADATATSTTTPVSDAQVANGRLRGLLNKLTGAAPADSASPSAMPPVDDKTPPPVKELVVQWNKKIDSKDTSELARVEKIAGDEAIVVFYDRSASPLASAESAVVTFDVRSRANCVVSVCGLQRNWYMRTEERCFDLRIAQKSLDESKNGLIRGISAAYSSLRPVASKLYLKFDASNFIDGSACAYEIISGSKTVTEEATAVGSSGSAVALS